MRRRAAATVLGVLLGFGAAAAVAQDLPASFQVRDVAQGDVLNIRAEPTSSAAHIGDIPPFAVNVEVLEKTADGKWGRVGTPEGNGWVSMRYLELTPPADPFAVPRPLSCFGTEPFWHVGLFPKGAEFNSPETGAVPMTSISEAVAPEGFLIRLEEGPTLSRTLVITRQTCHDGMSDRVFGFSTKMFLEAPDGNGAYDGCCTLDHR